MERLLPILSGSLFEILQTVEKKYDDPIAKIICFAHTLTKVYNDNSWINEENDLYALFQLVPDKINEMITSEVRMIAARMGGEFEVSFLPEGKDPEYTGSDTWGRRNRQTGKPTRIFRRLVRKEFKTYDWEVFNNRLKSEICCCTNFKLVEGEAIREWYHHDKYFKIAGTLGNSCMQHDECSNYFDVYVDNAKMLITTKDGLLTGRAIVWNLPDGRVLMDRIYTCFDYLENCFKDYAKDNGWWIREHNSLLSTGDVQGWLTPEDDYKNVIYDEIRITLKKKYRYFPYVDSFRYFDGDKTLSTDPDSGFNYTLDRTDGEFESREECTWVCDRCGSTYYSSDEDSMPDELVYSDYDSEYLCEHCRWWCSAIGDWVSVRHNTCEVITPDGTELYPDDWVEDSSLYEGPIPSRFKRDYVVTINDVVYRCDVPGIMWDEEKNEFYLNEQRD